MQAGEFTIAAEKGIVTIGGSKVTVKEGEEVVTEFKDDENGVKQEVGAWAQSIIDGKPDSRQSPEEALADLEILEKMLKSGENLGKTEHLKTLP